MKNTVFNMVCVIMIHYEKANTCIIQIKVKKQQYYYSCFSPKWQPYLTVWKDGDIATLSFLS